MSQKLWGGLSQNDINNLKPFVTAIEKDNYFEAIKIAKEMKGKSKFDDTMLNIALWNKYSQIGNKRVNPRDVSFNDISRFVNDNQFFSNIKDLQRNAEKVAIANNTPYKFSKQHFNNFPAKGVDSKLYLLKSQIDQLNSGDNTEPQKDINNLVPDIWINESFTEAQEKFFLLSYGNKLTEENHIARIERLLWDKKEDEAKRIFYLINEDQKKLFNAIIAIRIGQNNITNIISSIPKNLRSNELLAYKIIVWKKANISKGDPSDLIDALLEIPALVSNPDKWWSLKNFYARELFKTKDYKKSYKLVSTHGLKSGSPDFADAEWISGWIALRFLGKPEVAYRHFHNMHTNVVYPVSISRSAYWLGMASLAKGDEKRAIEWYKVAAKYPTYFYGQLAIHKHRVLDSVGSQNDIILPKDPDILNSDIISISNNQSLKTAYILALIGNKKSSTKAFEYAVSNAKTDGEVAVIMKVVNELKDKELDVKISKIAAKRNVFFIKDKFQILKEIENDPDAPLIHAIIKQESGFAPSALSHVGAIGFMQVMPTTAQLVCKQMGVEYDKHKLSTDINYNIKIGSFYIKSLIDQFGGSELLAIASYNAGPFAAKRWVNQFYDPRKEKDVDKIVDWIELISYAETRNYVQRIMENLIVYKYLMSRTNYDDIK